MAFSKQIANTSLYLCGACMEIVAYVQVLNVMIPKAFTSSYNNFNSKTFHQRVLGGSEFSHFEILLSEYVLTPYKVWQETEKATRRYFKGGAL